MRLRLKVAAMHSHTGNGFSRFLELVPRSTQFVVEVLPVAAIEIQHRGGVGVAHLIGEM